MNQLLINNNNNDDDDDEEELITDRPWTIEEINALYSATQIEFNESDYSDLFVD